jgi:hypothetical protein
LIMFPLQQNWYEMKHLCLILEKLRTDVIPKVAGTGHLLIRFSNPRVTTHHCSAGQLNLPRIYIMVEWLLWLQYSICGQSSGKEKPDLARGLRRGFKLQMFNLRNI